MQGVQSASNLNSNIDSMCGKKKSAKKKSQGTHLVQHQHQARILQQLIRTDRREQLQRIVDPVRPRVFFQVLRSRSKRSPNHRIASANRAYEKKQREQERGILRSRARRKDRSETDEYGWKSNKAG